MNSKTAQLTKNGTAIVRLFARFALGASFLSPVADRFGLWGPYGAKNVSWGKFANFVKYTDAVMSFFPSSLTVSFAWAATVGETLWYFAHRRLQNTNGLRPLRSSTFVICYGHGHRSWYQDAI